MKTIVHFFDAGVLEKLYGVRFEGLAVKYE